MGALHKRVLETDPLPPSAALPLFQGGEWLYCPPYKGGQPRSGRGSLTRHVEVVEMGD
jgi:hypothetical protein